MSEPLIGITTWRVTSDSGHGLIANAEAYAQAISRSGGLPVMIPVGTPADQLTLILSRLDGLVFTGGGDIDPKRYGLETNSKVKNIDRDRDRVEIQLVRIATVLKFNSCGMPFSRINRFLVFAADFRSSTWHWAAPYSGILSKIIQRPLDILFPTLNGRAIIWHMMLSLNQKVPWLKR
jgi:hypothetical protein